MITKFNDFLNEDITQYKQGNFHVLFRNDKLTVLVPQTFESCLITTRNTQWCTKNKESYETHKSYNMFRFLFKDGTKLRLTVKKTRNGNYEGHWGLGEKNDYKYFYLNWYDMKKNIFDYQKGLEYIMKKQPNLEDILDEFNYNLATKDKRRIMNRAKKIYNNDVDNWNKRFNFILKISEIPQEAKDKVIQYMNISKNMRKKVYGINQNS